VLRDAGVEAVAFPTTPVTARAVGEDDTVSVAGEPASTFGTYTRYTNLAGVIGTPGISLPVGSHGDGLPIGVELDGLHGHDHVLLRIAEEVESDLGVP
jgi:Asp-tRNA(Asn)/Glu-tRNA(Gln) amidotransferase A subunit family amidase